MPAVLNDWVCDLTYMQQSVLLSMVRNADGIAKHHEQKELIKWYRRCVLRSAFDGRTLEEPTEPGGGSFTGPVDSIHLALDHFIWSRDEMTLHYFSHAMQAFEVLGYKHPEPWVRAFWHGAFLRMIHALHQNPETEYEMDKRLCDNIDTWRAREDKTGACTSTTPPCPMTPDARVANVGVPSTMFPVSSDPATQTQLAAVLLKRDIDKAVDTAVDRLAEIDESKSFGGLV